MCVGGASGNTLEPARQISSEFEERGIQGLREARKSTRVTSIKSSHRRVVGGGGRRLVCSVCVDFQLGKHALMAPTALL